MQEALQIVDGLDDAQLEGESILPRFTFSWRSSRLAPEEIDREADALHQRLLTLRDPIRLNEFYFFSMWRTLNRGPRDRCVKICDQGIALSNQIRIPPVQYATLKSFALMDLGQFDLAWASLEQEVSDADHRFGAANRQLAMVVYLQRVCAHERSVEMAQRLIPEVIALRRPWMMNFILTALGRIMGHGEGDTALIASIQATIQSLEVAPNRLMLAEMQSLEGNLDEAHALVLPITEGAKQNGLERMLVDSAEVELRILAKLNRWQDSIARADDALATTARSGFDALRWRILAHRSAAHLALEDARSAEADLEGAAQLLRSISATIPEPEHRRSLEADRVAVRVLSAGTS